ncbi:aldolase/citrate lyase family protein [bacterium]|nr:aldolase/citrate lyase family protein [bacterium]
MNSSLFKNKLRSLEPVIGTWVTMPSCHSLDAICREAIDFVILDQEHGSITQSDLLPLINTSLANQVAPIVRPSLVLKDATQYALDSGAYGVQFPNIDCIEDAHVCVDYVKYPPIGSRGYSPFVPASGYKNNGPAWNQLKNDETILVLNIEGQDAIQDVEKICRLDQVDCIFVGLFDLSKSLGIPGQVNNPKVSNLLQNIVDCARNNGKSVGTIATSNDSMKRCLEMGANYIVYMVDTYMLRHSYSSVLAQFHKEVH